MHLYTIVSIRHHKDSAETFRVLCDDCIKQGFIPAGGPYITTSSPHSKAQGRVDVDEKLCQAFYRLPETV